MASVEQLTYTAVLAMLNALGIEPIDDSTSEHLIYYIVELGLWFSCDDNGDVILTNAGEDFDGTMTVDEFAQWIAEMPKFLKPDGWGGKSVMMLKYLRRFNPMKPAEGKHLVILGAEGEIDSIYTSPYDVKQFQWDVARLTNWYDEQYVAQYLPIPTTKKD